MDIKRKKLLAPNELTLLSHICPVWVYMLAKKTNDQPPSPVRRPTLRVFPQLYIREVNVAGSEHVRMAL